MRFYVDKDGTVRDRRQDEKAVDATALCAYLNELESRLNELEAFVDGERTSRMEASWRG